MYFHLIFYKYFQGLILVILIISIEQITWVRKCFFFIIIIIRIALKENKRSI